jgi:hypothetical protein
MDFTKTILGIQSAVDTWELKLNELNISVITERRNKQNRTIKQILGHLVDSASNNHQRMVRLQYNPELVFPDYRQDNDLWIAIQDYQHAEWNELIQLWKFYNLHIIQVIRSVDKTKLGNCWHDFEGTRVTLHEMIEGYLWHLNLHLNEIQELVEE